MVSRYVSFTAPPLLQSSIQLSLLPDPIDTFLVNLAAQRKSRIDLHKEGTSPPVPPVISNAKEQLEYESHAPSKIQDPAKINVVPRGLLGHNNKEFIAGFPIDDELLSTKPIMGVNRDIHYPATQDKGS
jgi:hypothetical protein